MKHYVESWVTRFNSEILARLSLSVDKYGGAICEVNTSSEKIQALVRQHVIDSKTSKVARGLKKTTFTFCDDRWTQLSAEIGETEVIKVDISCP
jgi:hypothetical protein